MQITTSTLVPTLTGLKMTTTTMNVVDTDLGEVTMELAPTSTSTPPIRQNSDIVAAALAYINRNTVLISVVAASFILLVGTVFVRIAVNRITA
jgi:hypothetical protein